MDEIERKYLNEIKDLLSSVNAKIFELLKTESKETFLEETIEVKDEKKIVWTIHDGKKFKPCKYKCGHFVSWDDNTKKYIHYDAAFKLIGECPKFA